MATRARPLPAPRPRLRVIRGRGGTRTRMFFPAAVVLVLAIFAVTALQAYLGQEGLRASRLERQVVEAEERSALLRARVAELSSPQRLQEMAEAQGMVPGPDPIFLPAPDELRAEGGASDRSPHRAAPSAPGP